MSREGCQGQDEMVGWLRVLGSWGDMEGDSNTAGLDRNLSGFMLGTDRQLGDQWRGGVAAGYTHSDIDAQRRQSDATINSTHLAAYLNSQHDALAVRLGAAYSWHRISTKRNVSVGSYNDRLKANYDARSAQVFGEVGYALEAAGVALEPFVGLAYVNYDSDTGREKGGAGRLSAKSSQDITFSTVGLRAGKRITLGNGSQITPRAALGWRHAYGDTKPDADLTFIEGAARSPPGRADRQGQRPGRGRPGLPDQPHGQTGHRLLGPAVPRQPRPCDDPQFHPRFLIPTEVACNRPKGRFFAAMLAGRID